MDLGTFSISLAVEDLAVSKAFYGKLGFAVVPADPSWSPEHGDTYDETWVILQQGEAKIGLFQKMFDKNTLTFNPRDVRAIQKRLKASGVELVMEADEDGTGPAHCVCIDPDGNPILFDQH